MSGVPLDVVPWLLLVFGVGSTLGVLLGGRLADWKLMASLVGILAVQLVIYLLDAALRRPALDQLAALVADLGRHSLRLWLARADPHPSATRRTRHSSPRASIPSAFNIAIAAGAWLGGALIDGGYSYGVLPWTGVVATAIAVTVAAISRSRERRCSQ